ncbi:DUF3859 domain-containing protein [Phreatobacter sp.]|uniref:DUF3859 domain-containing protein n=1 Tax=Phreatobacter sp. TaxID=1966341 RepID=UPI003F6FDB97
MTVRALAFATCLAALTGAAPAAAVEIVDWGIVERAPVIGTTPSDTLVGRNRLIDPDATVVIAERTTTIAACLGTRFGILFRATGRTGPAGTAIDVTVHHPEQIAPDGRRRSLSRWRAQAFAQTRYAGWHFDKRYELVPGTWTFVLSAGGRELARRSFTLVRSGCQLVS